MGFIYVIQNTTNKKFYVGQTKRTVSIRWREHRSQKQRLLCKAIRKYGVKSFVFVLVREIPNNELDDEETRLISENNSLYPNGYNKTLSQTLTREQASKGGSSKVGHDKQSLKMKERYKNHPRLRNIGDVPRGISYYHGTNRGYEVEGFKVRKVGIKPKGFLSVVKKNNLQYNLNRAKNYLSQSNHK